MLDIIDSRSRKISNRSLGTTDTVTLIVLFSVYVMISTWFPRLSRFPFRSTLSSRSGRAARSARSSERQLDWQCRVAVAQSTADLHLTLAVTGILPP